MSQRARFWCAFSLLALSLLVPGWSYGAEIPGGNTASTEIVTPAEAPQVDVAPDQEPITLEELKRLVGPHNVCGATCGPGRPSCYTLCGDAAACVSGRCIWL
ncbi:MAG TPA: hypothetical protein VN493_16390 [Thermoanaerobaculia bacterium]|nr:hypothetical protein [Thermoanaerobaculia bacterium]